MSLDVMSDAGNNIINERLI